VSTTSPPLDEFDYSQIQLPTGRWSLLCVRGWMLGMAINQVPDYTLGDPPTAPALPVLPVPDRGITGQTKFNLELQAAIIKREWEMQALAPEKVWTMGYRQEYQQAWLPLHFGDPSPTTTDSVANTPEPHLIAAPDALPILCPTHMVGQMCEQAASLLILRPGNVTRKNGQVKIRLVEEPCLTIVRGFLGIEAHLVLQNLSISFLPKAEEFSQGWAVQKIYSACREVKSRYGVPFLLPLLQDPLALSVQPY